MSDYNIIEEVPIPNGEIVHMLEAKLKKKELTYREQKILDYFKKIKYVAKDDADKIIKDLEGLEIENLSYEIIVSFVNILPKNGTEIRAISSPKGLVLVDEDVTKILEVLKPYLK